jgi:type VI protein secretion system component Hcp
MKTSIVPFIGLLFLITFIPNTRAAIYLNVPDIPGPGAPQKFPASMPIRSFLMPSHQSEFSITRNVDSLSADFAQYAVNGQTLSNLDVVYYKVQNEQHDPYVDFHFHNNVISSYSISGSSFLTEHISFNYGKVQVAYLKIHGGPSGETSPPNFPAVHLLNSFSMDDAGLTINKNVDSASASLSDAVAAGTVFPSVDLLLYDLPVGAPVPVDPPIDMVTFYNVRGTSYAATVGAVPNTEQISFTFADASQIPEPASLALLAVFASAANLRIRGAAARQRKLRAEI